MKNLENNRRNGKQKNPPGKQSKKATPKGDTATPSAQESPTESGIFLPQEDPLELAFPDGLETLLPIKARKPLPELPESKAGPKCKLVQIIQNAPALYQKMISKLRVGVSPNVAAELVGVSESTFYAWAEQGAKDIDKDQDTYFSRFYRDVRRAIAVKTGECEETLAKREPKIWLSRGPARIFGNRWSKNPEKPAITQSGPRNGQAALPPPEADDVIDATFTITHKEDLDEVSSGSGSATGSNANSSSGNRGQTLDLSPEQEFETLKVLEGIGQVTLSDSLKKAFEDQISSDSVEQEEPEDQEDE